MFFKKSSVLISTIILLVIKILGFSWAEVIPEPPNLGILKNTIKAYIDSGSYYEDILKVVQKATEYLYTRYNQVSNPAVVFDLDETLLSNIEYEYIYDFGFSYESWIEWVKQSKAKPIQPVQNFFKTCQNLKVTVFIITGRTQLADSLEEDPTIINLKKAGYFGWKKIFFKPIKTKISTIEYKSNCRKEIENMGYKIIINMGDQWSDLIGGHSEQIFKLPNPMYYIP